MEGNPIEPRTGFIHSMWVNRGVYLPTVPSSCSGCECVGGVGCFDLVCIFIKSSVCVLAPIFCLGITCNVYPARHHTALQREWSEREVEKKRVCAMQPLTFFLNWVSQRVAFITECGDGRRRERERQDQGWEKVTGDEGEASSSAHTQINTQQ